MIENQEKRDEKLEAPNGVSVVKISTTALAFDYEYPWRSPVIEKWGGSGFLMELFGGMRLVTNAHVASDAVYMEVQFAHDATRYSATLQHVSDECDLAMVAVEDPEFWQRAKPLEMAEVPEREDYVKVMGFPVGGASLSITDGIVSRSELDNYAHSGRELTVAQISAPINPGNSGGPVVNKDGKLVGVVHQGYPNGQNLGFMIPANILQHFGKQVEKKEKGFPDLSIKVQNLENRFLREHYQLPAKKSGVLVKEVAKLSCAHGILHEGDIIMEIDGVPINNDGTVFINPMKKIEFEAIVQQKALGEEVTIKLWRNGGEDTLKVKLTSEIGTTDSIIPMEHNKRPSYYIASGQMVIQPVTENFIQAKKLKYENKAKELPDDQLIAINMMLNSGYTTGYRGLDGQLIKEINGKKIRNMKDVVWAFDSNIGKTHVIKTDKGNEIVIPNLNAAQVQELLDRYYIPKDRSDDLPKSKVEAVLMDVAEEVEEKEEDKPEEEALDPMTALFFTKGLLDMFKPKGKENGKDNGKGKEEDNEDEDELSLTDIDNDDLDQESSEADKKQGKPKDDEEEGSEYDDNIVSEDEAPVEIEESDEEVLQKLRLMSVSKPRGLRHH